MRPSSFGWARGAIRDLPAWRARGYFALKLPVAIIGLVVAVGFWLAGLFYLTYPIWWELAKAGPWLPGAGHIASLAGSFLLVPLGARHATLEAVHVPGLLRIRVTDDGHGGASPVPGGGLRGLAERLRTVDGHMDIDSPSGGPTVVTVELPSHA